MGGPQMREHELYELWLKNATEDPDLVAELESIKGDDEAVCSVLSAQALTD